MRELRPLRLPQMLEARKKEDANISPQSQHSRSTSSPDRSSPVTPTFSLRGHGRFPSSTSSLASSPAMRESMDGFCSGKRPLTEVKEEPQERDDDYEMVDSLDSPDHDCKLRKGTWIALGTYSNASRQSISRSHCRITKPARLPKRACSRPRPTMI